MNIPITNELLDDNILDVETMLYKRLLVIDVLEEVAKNFHRGMTITADVNGIKYKNAILKSRYKLGNGSVRVRYIVDERNAIN
jgi:hypothetical protein